MAFGRSNSLSINTGAGNSLFGGANPSGTQQQQQQPPTGLFGAPATSQPQQSTPFGASATSSQPQQQQQSGGLFGAAAASKPASGGMFGSSTQPQQSGGGLFGASTANTNANPTGGSLFGSSMQNQNQGAGLYASKPATGGGLFGNSTAQQPSNNFGSSMLNPLGSSTAKPLAGSLTMGQGNAPQQPTVPGARIDLSNLRPTTRFSDLHDEVKKQIESIDSFIRQQESYSAQCEAILPAHAANVDSIKPDVDLISAKIETVELALENDGTAIENAKALVQRDASDLFRVARMCENLSLPSQYHYGRNRPKSDDEYDIDLVAYFTKQAEAMQQTLETYTTHMAEIEAHLRVVEASTIQQGQQLAAQRAGGRAENGTDTVRELAETLRGFESGILGAAGLVGSCREGVNELIMGKKGADPRDSVGYGGRRSVRF